MSAGEQIEPAESIHFRILPERRLALVFARGSLTTYVLAEAMAMLYRAPQWQPGFDIVWDIRRISEWRIDWNDTRAFIELDREMSDLSGGGTDFVLVDNDLHFTNVETYAILSRGNPRRVVPARNIAAVAEPLQVPLDDLSRELDALRHP